MIQFVIQLIQRHFLNRILTAVLSAVIATGGGLLARVPRPITLLLAVILIGGAVWAFTKALQRRLPSRS